MNNYKKTPLWNSSLSLEERLNYLTANLTLEEKFSFLTTGSPTIERLGITPFHVGGEAAHGIEARHDQEFNKGEPEYTTSFPQPIGMSASWDTQLLEEIGQAVGNEARILYQKEKTGGLCRWAPTVDMERDPRWGRTEEAYGEDPLLTGKMASAYIQGMRGRDPFYIRLGATLKHFYANNVEQDRIKASSSIDPRNKYEYYLEPFRRTIQDGKAEAVMTAYNEINGIPAISNPEVQTLLKDMWGLPGHVVCDGGDMTQNVTAHQYCGTHAETIADGLRAGIDCFTDDHDIVIASAREAYEKGIITEDLIDRSIRNSFTTKIRLGLFDGEEKNPYANIKASVLDSQEHRMLSLKAAEKGTVLLKNNNLLPLAPDKSGSIAIVGPLANAWYKDWYSGIPSYSITPEAGLREIYGNNIIDCETSLDKIKIACKEGYLAVTEDGRIHITSSENAEIFELTDWGCGSCTLQAQSNGKYLRSEQNEGYIKAISDEAFAWFIKEAFDIKANEENLGAFTIESWNDNGVFVDKEGYLVTGEGSLSFTIETVKDGIEAAKSCAALADVVICIVGCNPVINSKEEVDRTDITLPPKQEALLQAIYETNPNVICVLISNYPYAINWVQEHIPAILQTASGSQELGRSIARLIAGKASPAGRLNMTWYQNVEQLPDINDYDIIKGKRTYQYFDGQVLYPFGYGLSYTTFAYHNLKVECKDYTTLHVSVEVENTGERDGEEVVQIYSAQKHSRVLRPNRQLRAFERIFIAKGDKKELHFIIPVSDFRYYDTVTASMVLETGEYEIEAGASSSDIRQHKSVLLQGQTIGNRDMDRQIPADHYDDYENIILHRGSIRSSVCATAIMPLCLEKPGKAVYKDVLLHQSVTRIQMDILAKESVKIKVTADNEVVGIYEIEAMKFFANRQFELDSKKLPMDKSFTLELILEGDVRITSFQFV